MNLVLYQSYQFQDDLLAPLRMLAKWQQQCFGQSFWGQGLVDQPAWGGLSTFRARSLAALEMVSRLQLTHTRPDFGIDTVLSGNQLVPVSEEVALDLPFGKLLHFTKEVPVPQPKVLVIVPLSGHFSTLLRGTVETLLQDHDVYLTDWSNARDVPESAGRFGVDEYIDYLIRFLEEIGPRSHILAVCQPCVQALAAVAVMSEQNHPATPLSMTLMAGPIDTRESPTAVNDLAAKKTLEWFAQSVIATVPARYPGGGRKVYPGFLQLFAFMSMNMDRHRNAHVKMHNLLAKGQREEAAKIKDFYDEYFAVLDLTEEFYLETIDRIFQNAELAEGRFEYRGKLVRPDLIHKTALLTVEGGRDDICALGQTAAAHDLCSSLRPHLKRHHLQANVGHYGVFNGKRWQKEIYPVVQNMILAME